MKAKIIKHPQKETRADWETAFKKIAVMNDDKLLTLDNLTNKWDEDEWQW